MVTWCRLPLGQNGAATIDPGDNVIGLLKREPGELLAFLRRNYREMVVICLATLFLTLNRYHPIEPGWVGSLVYYAALPVVAIPVLLRKNPLDFGFRLGNWRVWGFHVIVVVAIGAPVLYFASQNPSVAAYYLVPDLGLLSYSLETVAILFGWEFLFRGFLLFGLKEKLQEASILVQMVPFALLHFGKPEVETISTVITGIYFGYVVYRGNSYWPAFLMHIFIDISTRVFVNFL